MPYRKILHDLYLSLPANFSSYLFDGSLSKDFTKESFVTRQGEAMKDFIRVESGIVRAIYTNGNSSITTEFYFPGEMIDPGKYSCQRCFAEAFKHIPEGLHNKLQVLFYFLITL